MLSTQFFNRVQLAKLLDFKSDSSIKELEKKEFIKPDIKPSKYSLTQVFFLFFCKELVDYTHFSWKDLIKENFNTISQNQLYLKGFAYFFKPEDLLLEYMENGNIEDFINIATVCNLGYLSVVMFDNDFLNKDFEQSYEIINTIKRTDEINTVLIMPMKNGNYTVGVSLRRLKLKFTVKCEELNINLTEKIVA